MPFPPLLLIGQRIVSIVLANPTPHGNSLTCFSSLMNLIPTLFEEFLKALCRISIYFDNYKILGD